MDLKEILGAWKNVAFSDDIKKAIAEKRRSICNQCEKKGSMIGVDVCTVCYCPLLGKTHSEENSCPLNKWIC